MTSAANEPKIVTPSQHLLLAIAGKCPTCGKSWKEPRKERRGVLECEAGHSFTHLRPEERPQ